MCERGGGGIMELIRWAIDLGTSVYGNTHEELIPLLDYYYDHDHLKAFVVANLILEMDIQEADRPSIELKRCVAAYYAGLYKVAKKYANEMVMKYPNVELYEKNAKVIESFFNKEYDYCFYIWPYTYGSFIDVARALKWQLEQQGQEVIISETLLDQAKQTVLFGAHLFAYRPIPIPNHAIVYNLEQLYDESPYVNAAYLTILKDREVWDYSRQNIEWLKQKGLGKEIKHVKMNYAPTLEIKKGAFPHVLSEDIDVLFIGAMNERRQAIFEQLQELAPNLNIVFQSNVWGIPRNELMARAKIILNIHFHLTGILETPRISHAVANQKFIISESSNPEDEKEWPGIVFAPYEQMVEMIIQYSKLPEERRKLAEKAYWHFKAQKS